MATPEKILFVDDEPAALQGYQRMLHGSFNVDIAGDGKSALAAMKNKGPYAVVVSDLRMREMNGLEFLAQVKTVSPGTVRILLTGQAALETAVSAINENNIFRFLTKPCPKEKLTAVLTAAIEQYHLLITEKDVLEKTFLVIMKMLTDVLGLANPAAFSRSVRLRRYVKRMSEAAGLREPWKVEVAAMVSQLGCVTLDAELINAVHKGQPLTQEQQARYDRHPEIAQRLLAGIPRMEEIAWMVAHQNKAAPMDPDISNLEKAEMRKGATILRQAMDFDDFIRKGTSRVEAGHRLARKYKNIDQKLPLALIKMEPEAEDLEVMTCPVEQLPIGMAVYEDLYSSKGLLVVAKGQETNPLLRIKLDCFNEKEPLDDGIVLARPKPAPAM